MVSKVLSWELEIAPDAECFDYQGMIFIFE